MKTPKRVKVEGPTTTSLKLRWKDTSRSERFFEIKIGPGSRTIKAARNTTTKTITGLDAGATYSLKIRACEERSSCSRYSRKIEGVTAEEPLGSRPLFGYNETVTPGAPGNALLSGSGADFVRVPIGWANQQPTPLTYNWRNMDAIKQELASRGLKPLWVISSAPCWAQLDLTCSPKDTAMAPASLFYGAYANFIVQVAKRYPDSTAIQVWNEPNIPKFWRPAPSSSAYRSLLTQTLSAVTAAGVKVPIVFGAPSPVSAADAKADPTKIPTTTFFNQVLNGGMPNLDAVAVHPYSFLEGGDQIANSIERFDEAEAVLKNLVPNVPVWVTEVGFTTSGRHRVSAQEQADALTSVYRAFVQRGVKLITVHRFFDDSTPPYPFEAGMGVIAADQSTPKPAYCALAELRGATPAVC